jgi:hypothetical protein
MGRTGRRTERAAFLALLLLCPVGASAQIGRRDLEDLERHRPPTTRMEGVQSWEDDSQALGVSGFPILNTWDFLEEEEGEGEVAERLPPVVDLPTVLMALPAELMPPACEYLEAFVRDYVSRHGRSIGIALKRYYRYEPLLRTTFEKYGLPEDLTLLAVVESAMNPRALSSAGARGMWQFMPRTARSYGLRCDGTVDDRLDVALSTDAAARYLQRAYGRFGSWPLAISSYNCGPGGVEKAIARAGGNGFWEVYPYLSAETRGYLPAFVAVLYFLYIQGES